METFRHRPEHRFALNLSLGPIGGRSIGSSAGSSASTLLLGHGEPPSLLTGPSQSSLASLAATTGTVAGMRGSLEAVVTYTEDCLQPTFLQAFFCTAFVGFGGFEFLNDLDLGGFFLPNLLSVRSFFLLRVTCLTIGSTDFVADM